MSASAGLRRHSMPKEKVKKEVLDLRVTLLGVDPPVWRLIAVPSEIPLLALHLTIQGAMGWRNEHLHAFVVGGKHFEGGVGSRTSLNRKVGVGDVFRYLYDFGDHWEHEVRVERAYEVKSRRHYPKCLDGAGACPPEDVGGLPGYAHLLDVLADPTHPEYEAMRRWLLSTTGRDAMDSGPFWPQGATWQIQVMLTR